jgi:hypothetical protein
MLSSKSILFGAGTVLVGVSGSLVGTFAFEGNTFMVFLGFMVFVFGYKTCSYGEHHSERPKDTEGEVIEKIKLISENFKLSNIFLILIGVYLCSYVTVGFADMVESPSVLKGVESGVASFGGYIIAHKGVNEVPI